MKITLHTAEVRNYRCIFENLRKIVEFSQTFAEHLRTKNTIIRPTTGTISLWQLVSPRERSSAGVTEVRELRDGPSEGGDHREARVLHLRLAVPAHHSRGSDCQHLQDVFQSAWQTLPE